jgi:hypothetical protein
MVNQCEGQVVVETRVARPGIFCKNRQLMEKEVIVIQEALGKDFNLQGCENQPALLKRLSVEVNHLIQADFHRLIAILYRLDISELKLKRTLEENTDKDAGELIAMLIIERQLQKIHMRQSFKPQQDIPEDEKW